MKQAVQLGCVLVALFAPAGRADLSTDVEALLGDKALQRATVGVEIVRMGKSDSDSKLVYDRNAHTPLMPASNLKLTTTSAALDKFGPDFKFHTTLLQHGEDLVLIGDGDPSFGDAEYLRRVGWKPTTVYENWAAQLKKLNVKSVRDVIVDDSVFDEEFLHPHWPLSQIDHDYEAEVGGLNFDANCILFLIQPTSPGKRVDYSLVPNAKYLMVDDTCVTGQGREVQLSRKPGSNDIVLGGEAPGGAPSSLRQTIHDPPMYGAAVLVDVLGASGITVTGHARRDRSASIARQNAPAGEWKTLGIHETPLAVALARANKDSMNLYAESLCKRLGREVAHASGSWENGTSAVGAFLKKTGIPESEFHLDDGSGLSHQNRVTPHALIRVLTYDFFSPNHDAFLNSLSITGSDGTLAERFRGSDLRHRVIGKSGFIEGVSCLSGFVKARDNQWYAFSIMMNGMPPKSAALAHGVQEKIVRALDLHAAGQK